MAEFVKSGGVCLNADFIRSFGSVTDFLKACEVFEFNFDTPENIKLKLKEIYYDCQGKAPKVAKPESKAGSKRGGKGT